MKFQIFRMDKFDRGLVQYMQMGFVASFMITDDEPAANGHDND